MNRMLLRWSWRDLRGHWVAVVAIALVLAIGTGVFAGLRSTSTWRRQSNDASFAATDLHDLRVSLSAGTFAEQGALLERLATIGADNDIAHAAERLVVGTQIDASTPAETILVQARVVGMTFVAATEPGVDRMWVRDGRVPEPGGRPPEAVLEAKFADFYDLSTTGDVIVAGGAPVRYVGLGVGPEDFFVSGPEGSIFAQGDFAILSMDLTDAQGVLDRVGQVNDLVLTLTDGADRDAVAAQLRSAFEGVDGISAVVTDQDDVEAFRLLYDDIENDEQVWTMISSLVLFAAALAAFNLVSRIVEAQRREIGIGMALGVDRGRLAVRPLLVGAQIGLLGAIAGVGVGLLIGWAMQGLMESFVPLPHWDTSFQPDRYAAAAALGVAIPLLAAALPVWRAVRVEPIEAIRTGHLTARTNRFSDWTSRIQLPGSSLTHLPIRNIVRNPRRTILTAVGVGAAITALVAVLGMLDSFGRSIDQGSEELTRGDPERVLVALDTFHPASGTGGGGVVEEVAAQPAIGRTDEGIRLGALAVDPTDASGDHDIELLLELIDLDTAGWTPTIAQGDPAARGGILLAEKAAADLGVTPGDTVTIEHLAIGPLGPTRATSEMVVDGVHPNPIRTFAYADLSLAERFGLAGAVNLLNAYPAEGATRGDVQRAAFDLDGVASTQAVARVSEIFDEALEQFVGFLYITAGFVFVLAILIAFNSSRITVEERRREHATMRAFGLPVRTVLGVVVRESVVVGVGATIVGLGAGTLILDWMLRSLTGSSLPDFGISVHLAPATLLAALVVGVVAVAVAPLLLVRRIRRMDIPDTLRVME